MMSTIKRPYEGIEGTDRDDWLLSLDTRALAHREALLALTEHLYQATLVGNPAPKVQRMLERISDPRPGDLVVEISTIYRKRDAEHRVRALGVLLEKRQEWAFSDEEWAEEVADYGTRPAHTVWYVQYGPGAADVCRWEDCRFVMLPADLKAFDREAVLVSEVGRRLGEPSAVRDSPHELVERLVRARADGRRDTEAEMELLARTSGRNGDALRRLGE